MKKNVASQVIGAQMVSASDGSAFTGSVTCYVTGDGGTQAAGSVGSGACTHEGNGFHTYAPAQAETNYDHVAFTFTGSGAIPATVQVYPSFPQTGDSFARLGAPAGASVSADIAAVKSETASIVADTNELQTDWANGGRLDLILDARASQTSVDTIDGIVDAILVDTGTDIPASIATVDSNVDAILVDTGTTLDTIADNLIAGIIFGSAVTGTLSTTVATTDLTGYADDQLIGRVIIWLTGNCAGEATDITDYASTNGTLTFTALTTAPGNGDTFKIV